ncbi:hypothetical protein TrLO_g2167 [Triparma laevis f. longispina]|uniref:Uncharacterized protein n=1 Tax=Triparma laevis f. longispina TaxID=1714387 RepID=A0A9W7FUP1_9STRA|nr:hypothetical protein TrLO_g2167 [Triparma laevis f. longispina]
MLSETSLSAITAFLNCPEAPLFTGNFNKDLDIESKIVLQMDNIIQEYTGEKDGMIKSSLGLIAGRNMKGAIPFKEFTTIFSSTRFLNGFYNFKEGDIYAKSTFIVRSDHSRVAARMANYWYNCTNPAFGLSKGQLLDNEVYLEVPNSHKCVPNEYLPYDWRVKYKKTKGRVDDDKLKRRRGSMSVRELLGGKEER